jgi:hypothetical protein
MVANMLYNLIHKQEQYSYLINALISGEKHRRLTITSLFRKV